MNLINDDEIKFIWSGADSFVYVLWENKRVLKVYTSLSIPTVKRYHAAQKKAAELVQSELAWEIWFRGNFWWRVIRRINLRILELTQEMVFPLSEDLFQRIKLWWDLLYTGVTASNIPYVWWKTLASYGENPRTVKDLLDTIDTELLELGIPLGWANWYDWLHPINIKVFPENGDSISVVITDIGASVLWVISQNNAIQ